MEDREVRRWRIGMYGGGGWVGTEVENREVQRWRIGWYRGGDRVEQRWRIWWYGGGG